MGAPLCLIGLDLGTSACKALAIDGNGELVAQASASYPLATPQPGWAEHRPRIGGTAPTAPCGH